MKCQCCGYEYDDNAEFCPACGCSAGDIDLSALYGEDKKEDTSKYENDKKNESVKAEQKEASSNQTNNTSYTRQNNNENYQYHYVENPSSTINANALRQSKEKKSKKGSKVFLLIIGFLVVAGAAFYFGNLYGKDVMALIPSAYQWTEVDGQMYYMNNQGDKKTGWIKNNGNTYYCNESGAMLLGWQQIEDKWYCFDDDGHMYTGFQEINGNHYDFDNKGVMQTGWIDIDSSKYYFADSGAMLVGWQYIDNSTYYFDSEGKMAVGWTEIDGYVYYFDAAGTMVSNCTVLIDNNVCTFNENGVLVDQYTVETVADVANTSATTNTEAIEETVETISTDTSEYPVYTTQWEELLISIQRTGDITATLSITCNGSSDQYKFGPWVTTSSAVKVTTTEGMDSYAYISTDDFYFTYGSQFFVVGQTYDFHLTFDMGANSAWSNVELCLTKFSNPGNNAQGYAVNIPM